MAEEFKRNMQGGGGFGQGGNNGGNGGGFINPNPVSYTHLTLPTICSV